MRLSLVIFINWKLIFSIEEIDKVALPDMDYATSIESKLFAN
jgi:hypothetical protein|tara:strand:+ start:256 stop:381 length:126 start_codon:yes stop_codon:yes gene_type:complete